MSSQRFTKEFDEWCKQTQPPGGWSRGPEFGEFPNSENYIPSITKEGAHWLTLAIKSPNTGIGNWDIAFHAGREAARNQINPDIWTLSITGHFAALKISGLTSWLVHLHPEVCLQPLKFINCVIGTLDLREKSQSAHTLSLELNNCWIGTLALPQACLKNLTITGGGVAKIDCPPADGLNPFKGAVVFKNVFFPTSSDDTSLFEGPQGYRSLHAHLKKHDNMLIANQMRAHQLRSERSDENGFAYLTNWIYGTFANYGTSPGRPICWLLCVYSFVIGFIYTYDGGTLTIAADNYVGAYAALLDENGGRLSRSLLLPLNSIVNPFGIFFDSRKLIVPSTTLGSVLLTVQGVFSDVLVLMTVLSIRRRFKAE